MVSELFAQTPSGPSHALVTRALKTLLEMLAARILMSVAYHWGSATADPTPDVKII